MATPKLQELMEFAVNAAWQAGRITLAHFNAGVAVEFKADHTPVTEADRGAEQRLRDLIGQYWPDHGIWGEEFGRRPGSSPFTWILDPIDGTRSYIHGVPLYAVLVALVEDEALPSRGAPLVGVAHFPALNETVFAARGEGCYWDGRRVHVSGIGALAQATVLCSELDTFARHGKAAAWERLVAASGMQRTWGDAYGYALVATGRAEVMVDPIMETWDCGPHQVILEEAGGTFTDWHGKPTIYGRESVATNGALFDQVMTLVIS